MKNFILFVLLIFGSCKQELPSIPKDVLPIGKMEKLLVDMHMIDAVAETKAQLGEDEGYLSKKYTEELYIIHGTTRDEFVKSFRFYENNPALMNIIYDSVLNDLSKREELISGKIL